MKKNIITLFFILFQFYGKTQSNTKYTVSQYYYDTCQYLQQFAGEWRYTNGNDTIRFYFRVHKDSSENQKFVMSRLWGWHEYKKGNTIIESNYQNRFVALPYFSDTILNFNRSITLIGAVACTPMLDSLVGSIIDISQSRELHRVNATILTNNNIMTMNWKQMFMEWHGAFTGSFGMTLPKEFVLTKQ